jgi:UPF0755 protein
MRLQKWIIFSGVTFSLISLTGYLSYKLLLKDYNHTAHHQNSVTMIINPGQSARQISELLENAKVIDSAFTFFVNVVLRRQITQLKAGEYEFPSTRSIATVTRQLIQGKVVQHKITIPEGLTTSEVRDLLLKEEKLQGNLSVGLEEGCLLPETYYFTRGESRERILKRMQKALKDTLAQYWSKHHHETTLSTPEEALILASIVEKETSRPSERPHIAGVFLNRLKQRMPLQADPTVNYGIWQLTGKHPDRGLTKEELAINTPFNTYINIGLPPHPICNPGPTAIEATLNPMVTKDMYFVADGFGGHVFAETLKEHQDNHARWRKLRQERKQQE